ncbi:peptidase U32 family protein [Butyrivibrio sp. VCB2006]|uniref:peptidase U32 family protein n=1 Tax=Butyrivibrio sp. VCB2006 TaxID=1280679 RepID=UPI0004087070|nr:U32 family peptidase [Butyrivibrio sp. VCB2006]
MNKKVELLAPAGGYETMVGAFNAGADAVYLGGSKFGARAYADNFDTQQVLDAITYAHLHGKKIYMTVNTLVKEKEFGQVYDFMHPFAEKKLDGVIVQDLGVMRLIRDEFPEVELHASTQQTVTGVYGAKLLKELGCCRVVPARELSLTEMKAIREDADVEVEAFIHGAMCYCYSGVCLFSSMVGERSGNRGRCAQPCRLPYQMKGLKNNDETYPLSLKDMCTIDIIPELIEAGIDSFKIEGRMKRPEYAAGVTALYRKYIDMYYANPTGNISVSKEDMEILKGLYLRTGISEGYYHQHNGRNMVTISSPAYNGTSDKVLNMVKDKYLQGEKKIKCTLDAYLTLNEDIIVTMTVDKDGKMLVETVTGSTVQAASKRPMDEAAVIKQLDRLGNTPFEAEAINVVIEDMGNAAGIFVPASELNELRRELVDKMLPKLTGESDASLDTESGPDASFQKEKGGKSEGAESGQNRSKHHGDFHILVNKADQFKAVLDSIKDYDQMIRIYVDSDLFFSLKDELAANIKSLADSKRAEFVVALPFVTRTEEFDGTKDIRTILETGDSKGFSGVLVRNLEQLGFIKAQDYKGLIITDYGVYVWNNQAAALLQELADAKKSLDIAEISVPLELTIHEAKELSRALDGNVNIPRTYNIYGRTPMMVSAGCVKKTLDKCSGKLHEFNREKMNLVDRMGNVLPVTTNCRNCYNVIWNAHPTSLHKKLDNIRNMELFDHFRIDLTTESMEESTLVCGAYLHGNQSAFDALDQKGYTTGHFKREVE